MALQWLRERKLLYEIRIVLTIFMKIFSIPFENVGGFAVGWKEEDQ